MTVTASGTPETGAKDKYLWTLFRGGLLYQFDLLYADVENIEPLTVEYIIKVISLYFRHVIYYQKLRT